MEKEILGENLQMGTNSRWQHNRFLDNASSHGIGGDFLCSTSRQLWIHVVWHTSSDVEQVGVKGPLRITRGLLGEEIEMGRGSEVFI